jgi:hypothetical protein
MDVYVCFGENLKAHGTEAVLFSITAPGADQLPWDASACKLGVPHKHSGDLGCQVEAGQAVLWNESAQHRFSTAQREAKRRADVALRKLGSKRRISKCLSWWELQKRGVLHAHVVLPMGDAEERFWSRRYAEAWDELAGGHWFGYVDRWQRIEGKAQASEKVGRYVAGYTLSGRGKVPLERAIRDPRMPGPDVPYQPPPDGSESRNDAKRPFEPPAKRRVSGQMRLASIVRARARCRIVVSVPRSRRRESGRCSRSDS